MCHPLQAKRFSPSEDLLKQGWRIAKLAGVQAHANNKMEKIFCLQQFRQQVISTVPTLDGTKDVLREQQGCCAYDQQCKLAGCMQQT